MNQSYLTIKQSGESLFKDRGSRFIGHALHAETEEQAKEILDVYRRKYHDARHHCFGWRLSPDYSLSRANDDGEPGNSAGKPILNQIDRRKLTNTMVIVIRYFGGVKLGVGGLINAYRTAASDALDNAKISRRHITIRWKLVFNYNTLNNVMRIMDDLGAEIIEQNFAEKCSMLVSIRSNQAKTFTARTGLIEQCIVEPADSNTQAI